MQNSTSPLKRSIRLVLFAFLIVHPVLAQTTLNLSQDLIALGIASSNMVPNQPSLDAGPLLQSGVAYARDHNISTVIANPGSYLLFLSFTTIRTSLWAV